VGLKSSSERYSTIAIFIHWTSAVLNIGLLASGFGAATSLDPVTKAGILRLHVPIGVLVLALTLFRLAWRLVADHKP